jgi:hypothetical protein
MRAPITVVTASIPGREKSLSDTIASVYAQTVEVESHLVIAQSCSEKLPSTLHCARQQNALLPAVSTEWTMRLADDDQLLPHHVETVMPFFDGADVVYSWDANRDRPHIDCTEWSQARLVDQFDHENFIDGSAVCIRTTLLRKVGGWPTDWVGDGPLQGGHYKDTIIPFEDWACFSRLAKIGAKFRCVPQETWRYGNGSWPRISISI